MGASPDGAAAAEATARTIERARRAVATPALLLIIVGAVSMAVFLGGMLFNDQLMELAARSIQSPEGQRQMRVAAGSSAANYGLNGVAMALSLLVIAGGVQMRRLRSYGLAMAASVVSCVPCVGSCICLGLPFGIWGFSTLLKTDVKAGFEAARNRSA